MMRRISYRRLGTKIADGILAGVPLAHAVGHGQAHIAFADSQATHYRAGDFLHRHDDEVPGKNRIAAYVLGVTPHWRPEWGGLLTFMRPDGHVEEAWTPAFNTLNVLRVPQDHFVSQVAAFVESPRLAVTGWLRHV